MLKCPTSMAYFLMNVVLSCSLNILTYFQAWRKWREGTPLDLVDRRLRVGSGIEGDIIRCIQIGLLCVQENAAYRPTIGSVVHMLSSLSLNLPEPSEPAYSLFQRNTQNAEVVEYSEWRSQSACGDDSITDLYPR